MAEACIWVKFERSYACQIIALNTLKCFGSLIAQDFYSCHMQIKVQNWGVCSSLTNAWAARMQSCSLMQNYPSTAMHPSLRPRCHWSQKFGLVSSLSTPSHRRELKIYSPSQTCKSRLWQWPMDHIHCLKWLICSVLPAQHDVQAKLFALVVTLPSQNTQLKRSVELQELGGLNGTRGMFEHVKFPHQKFLLTQDFQAFGELSELAPDWTSMSDASRGSILETDAVMLLKVEVRH